LEWDGLDRSKTVDPDSSGDDLINVDGLRPKDVWAVGQVGHLFSVEPLAEHWNGSKWARSPFSRP
jgi:hypothetical protein